MAKLEKKGNKWYVRIWLKQQQRYKWIPTGSNVSRDNKRTLKLMANKEALVLSGLENEIQSLSLLDAFDEWIEDKSLDCKPSTITSYKLIVDDLLDIVNGNRKVANLCPADFRNLKRYYKVERKIDNVTINIRFRSLKAFLNWCIEQRYLKEMPFIIKKMKESGKEARFFTRAEFDTILSNTNDPVFQSYFRFAYSTGLRLGEINGTVWLIMDDKHYLKITKTKVVGNENRVIPVEPRLRGDWEMINAHQYKRDRVTKGFTKAVKLSGCYVRGRKTFHALRHSYGVEWVKNGFPLSVLSALMGHSSITITNDHYLDAKTTHLAESHVANA